MGQADNIRRAISKKKQKIIEAERKVFVYGDPDQEIPGCIRNGVPEAVAQSIYDEIVDFANYAFNKAHAVSYAMIAYQTAYLKAHYPSEYMAALLTSVLDTSTKVAEYITECRKSGIEVLPPDINESDDVFTVVNGRIRIGLVAVKNVGRNIIRQLMSERENGGNFKDFYDFCSRMADSDLNRRALENMIKCGSFDSLGYKRRQLVLEYEGILDSISSKKRKNIEGQMDLFGIVNDESIDKFIIPDHDEYSEKECMAFERATLGLYISGHPLEAYRRRLSLIGATTIDKIIKSFEEGLGEYKDGQYVTVAGVISSVKTKMTKSQSTMAYVQFEDETATMETLVFNKTLNECGNYILPDQTVIIKGRISVRDEKSPQIMCDSVRPIADLDLPEESVKNSIPIKGDSHESIGTSSERSITILG